MPPTNLESIPSLAKHRHALRALGYQSAESFASAVRVAPREMSAYLGEDVSQIVGQLPDTIRAQAAAEAPPTQFALGADISRVPRLETAYSFALSAPGAVLPLQVNWISQMPAVRNQGDRGTCVAFASLAVVEHYQGLQNLYQDMSEQFLYWDCKQNDGNPNGYGTFIAIAMKVLAQDGCCLETMWGYNPNIIPGNEAQGPVPQGAQSQALGYKVAQFSTLSPTSVPDLKAELARQRCVAFDIPVFPSWYYSTEVQRTGDITLPIPGEVRLKGGHAMCIVGYEDLPGDEQLGGGKFLLRNSWDSTKWAYQSTYGPGYGTIPYAYIARYGQEAYSIY